MQLPQVQKTSLYHSPFINKVDIKWTLQSGTKFLRFSFSENFDTETAERAVLKWEEEFSKIKDEDKIHLIWNCLAMKKYSADSAQIWKKAMTKMHSKVDTIWLVSNNIFFKMGAKTITFLLPINLIVVDSESSIKIEV